MKHPLTIMALAALAAGLLFGDLAAASGVLLAPAAAATLPDSIRAELEKLGERVGEPINELRSRLQNLEQHVAAGGVDRSGDGTFAGESMTARAAEMLAEDPAFAAAANSVERGVRPGAFSARATMDLSIRAAITNVGVGQTGDTSIDALRERLPYKGAPQPPLRLLDVLPSVRVSSNEVEFVQLGATGQAGEQMKEGDAKAAVAVAGTLATAKIATVAAHTVASRQVLSDSSMLQAEIGRLLNYKVATKLESLLLNGDGTASKIDGLLNQAAAIVPTIADKPADIVGEALMVLDVAGYSPSAVVMNPRDWFRLQLTRKNATDDEYVFGSPTSPIPPSLWNTPLVVTPAMPEGTGLALDTNFTALLDRWQAQVLVATEHEDQFVRNLVTILAELRAGLAVYDQNALLKFTLPVPA
jgi:HK97 family phage major capsid protein